MKTSMIAQTVLGTMIGLAVGVGGYTFMYAKGSSYLTNNPAACANCHIMQEEFSVWIKSSHRSVAVCNDCHTPPGFVAKYLTKAENGFWHSLAFTTGRYPDPIQIKAHNRAVTEKACRKCHQQIVLAIESPGHVSEQLACIRCHSSVGHANR